MPAFMYSVVTKLGKTVLDYKLSQVLHGEQYLEVFDELPTEGELITTGSVIDLCDKRSGALINLDSKYRFNIKKRICDHFNDDHLSFFSRTVNSHDQNGKLLVKNQFSTFIVGAGNFGGKSKVSDEVKPTVPTPNRPYDASVRYTTHVDQAAIYRFV